MRQALVEAATAIRARSQRTPSIGLVLGSGLGVLAEQLLQPDIIPYGEIPQFPRSTVAGHAGRLLLGQFARHEVIVMQGRAHFYEGYSVSEVTFPIRLMQMLGISTLVVTNAAGGLRPDLRPGDLMAIIDHIDLPGLAGHNPLRGPNDESLGPRFPSMSQAYDPTLLEMLRTEAAVQGIVLHEGVYVMVAGPSFETPAEVRFLRHIGADAVGMSTVPEVIVARHGGTRVLGVSLISNTATDSLHNQQETSHEQVLEAGRQAAPVLVGLLAGVIARLPPL